MGAAPICHRIGPAGRRPAFVPGKDSVTVVHDNGRRRYLGNALGLGVAAGIRRGRHRSAAARVAYLSAA